MRNLVAELERRLPAMARTLARKAALLASTDATTVTVERTVYNALPYGSDWAHNDRYYVENSLAALDSPGEWYLDETAHKLYYWPRDPSEIRNGEFVVPQLHQLIRGGSYQANSGWQAAALAQSYFVSCHHLGVYPKDPGSLSYGQSSFTVAVWLRFPSGTQNPFQDPFWVFSKGDPGDAAAVAGGVGLKDEFEVRSTRRWRRQSLANPSLETRNSLLAGKIQGNSSILASDIRISHQKH